MKHFCHCSAGSTVEIFLTLSRVLKQRVVEALRKSKAFVLLVDEVTDISVFATVSHSKILNEKIEAKMKLNFMA